MPSLMADLGAIAPRLTAVAALILTLLAVMAVLLAMAPTGWRVARRPLAASLSD